MGVVQDGCREVRGRPEGGERRVVLRRVVHQHARQDEGQDDLRQGEGRGKA